MKKYLSLFLALLLMLAMVGCNQAEPTTTGKRPAAPTTAPAKPTEPATKPTQPATPTQPPEPTQPHVHTPGEWAISLENHDQLCAGCGETLTSEAHTLDSSDCCTVCKAVFNRDEETGTEIFVFNDHGDSTLGVLYDADDRLLASYKWDYTYDSNGNMLVCIEYLNGVLNTEETFAYGLDGTWYTESGTTYYEDGSSDYTEYDQWGNPTRNISYDSEGNVTYNARHEYERNDAGLVVYQKDYEDNALVCETEYGIVEEADGAYTYPAKETTYYEDGSQQILEYNADFEITSRIYLDADGNVVDNYNKFDPQICAPLFGTWEGAYTVSAEASGVGMEIHSYVIVTFNEEGEMYTLVTYDEEELKTANINAVYDMYEAYGYTKENIDAMFKAEYGMSLVEYMDDYFKSEDGLAMLRQEATEMFYVEGDQIYSGEHWASRMEPATYRIDGDTLTLVYVDPDMGELVYILKKTALYHKNSLLA